MYISSGQRPVPCPFLRFPFEKLVREHDNISLIRLNLEQAVVPESFGERAVGIHADMAESIKDIIE